MVKLQNTFVTLFCLFLTFVMISCASVKQPKQIQQEIDYTDNDIVENEIKRINSLIETEPVKALWRSILLGQEDVTQRVSKNIEILFEKAIQDNDYYAAKRLYLSLESIGWKNSEYSKQHIEELVSSEVPGLGKNDSAPANISECMNATVTIWVDRGVKVEHGAGYADIVIGSGFFIDKRGYIITNHHVIDSIVNPKYEGYSRLYIKLLEDPDTRIPAKVVGYDSVLDLALLKAEIIPKYVLNLGSSKELTVGTKISAIGTPIGLEGTLTSGIVSSTERKLFTLGNVFQIDAAVNSGNSGGPLIDENMKVQAVVFAGIPKYQGLNFAIPVEYLKQELNLMYSCGEVIHPWIGCYGHTKKQGKKKTGLEIQYLIPGGSAKMSGMKEGDVITKVDGKSVNSLEDFQFLMMAYEPETLLKCEYESQAGETNETLIYLDKRPENPGRLITESDFICNSFVPLFGMKLKASSTLNRKSYTIEKIISGSTADQMSFSEYDAVTVRDMKFDDENNYVFVQLYTKRKKKGFLDITMVLSSSLDSPYYF